MAVAFGAVAGELRLSGQAGQGIDQGEDGKCPLRLGDFERLLGQGAGDSFLGEQLHHLLGVGAELRARLYTVAFFTGLRRGELASLTPRSFKLGGEHPTVTVDAACSKHRREDVLPLHPDLLVLLREWLPQLKPGEKLFPGLDRKKTWKMVKMDLARIGIPYETDEGVADFHAAGRHTYITELLRNGASLPEAKELARHTDVKMTMKYTHIGLEDQSKAVAGLRLPSPEPQDPGLMDESTEGGVLQMRCKFCGSEGHFLTSADAGESHDSNENPGVIRGYVAACHQVALLSKVEAPGIEPGSRTTDASASTCVACRVWRAEPTLFIAGPMTSDVPVRLASCEG